VVRAFSGNPCGRVKHVIERARVRRGVAISLGQIIAIAELVINEFEEGDSLLWVIYLMCMEGLTHYCGAGPILFVGDDEAHVERGMVKATKYRVSDLKS
jgi:hypothetical protein